MTLESGLTYALTAVTGALCFMFKLLWDRSNRCEQDRYELRHELEKLKEAKGVAMGELDIRRMCRLSDCPFVFKPTVETGTNGTAPIAGSRIGMLMLSGVIAGCAERML